MVARVAAHLAPGGLAFFVLPRRCVEAAGGETWATFEAALAVAGCGRVVARRASPKLAFWAVEKTAATCDDTHAAAAVDGGRDASAVFRVDAGAAARERERLERQK